jgi:hypothetical protein
MVMAFLLMNDVHAKTIAPRFSWDTVQPFLHFANTSGPFSDDAIAEMAKFPMLTIEKFQGPCAATSKPPTDTCHQEQLIVDILRRVKAVDASVCTIFYYNSILNFPQYDLSARFMENNASLCLRDVHGSLVTESGGHKSDMTVFDYQQPAACELWASTCINATKTGFVDGCFADRAIDVQAFETSGQLTPAQRAAFDKGHWDALAKLQTTIGAGPVIANHAYNLSGVGGAMIEFGKANIETVQDIQMSSQNQKVTQAHFSKIDDDSMATFLVAAGKNSYVGAGGWSVSGSGAAASPGHRWLPQYYERPLGVPLSDAVVSRSPADGVGSVLTRQFQSSAGLTNVTLTCPGGGSAKLCRGKIEWAGEAPTPPPSPMPPTPPPSPMPPAPQPTKSCPVVKTQCSYRGSDLVEKTAEQWADCCTLCSATKDCVKWVLRSGGGANNCRLHGAGAKMAAEQNANVCGAMH